MPLPTIGLADDRQEPVVKATDGGHARIDDDRQQRGEPAPACEAERGDDEGHEGQAAQQDRSDAIDSREGKLLDALFGDVAHQALNVDGTGR